MFFASNANGWTSKLIVVLQLITWIAVSIILLQKGISSLQRRRLETNHVNEETNLSTGNFTIEYTTVSSVRDAENENDFVEMSTKQSFDKSTKIIRLDSELLLENDKNYSKSNAINSFEMSTINRETPNSSWIENHLLEENEHINNLDNINILSKMLSKIRDHILSDDEVSKNEEEKFVLDLVLKEKENRDDAKTVDDQVVVDTSWKNKNRIEFSHYVSASGAAMAVAMIAIGTVMLLLGPTVMILRLLEHRRRAREPVIGLSAWEDSPPPKYEEAVLMNEAPRYSTLSLNNQIDDDE